jgi:leader peptidase (prepilin peptidase) / N-methyltransferase
MAALFFALGAIVASFVGVVSARLNTGHSIVRGRSRCDACNAHLEPLALVPVVSYFLTRGRARCCGARLSLYSPVTELLLGALFVLAYLKLGLSISLLLLLAALCLLLALVLYDFMHQILPPALLYTFVAVSLGLRILLVGDLQAAIYPLIVAAVIGFFFIALHVLSRGRAMGFADAPLAFGLALLVGSEYAPTGLVFSFWIGAVVGITILLQRPRGSRMGVEVPFAPFLAAGFLLAYFTQWNLYTLLLAS